MSDFLATLFKFAKETKRDFLKIYPKTGWYRVFNTAVTLCRSHE